MSNQNNNNQEKSFFEKIKDSEIYNNINRFYEQFMEKLHDKSAQLKDNYHRFQVKRKEKLENEELTGEKKRSFTRNLSFGKITEEGLLNDNSWSFEGFGDGMPVGVVTAMNYLDTGLVWIKRGLTLLAILFISLGIIGGGAGLGFFVSLLDEEAPQGYEEMAQQVTSVSSVSTMHYASGEVINELRSDLKRTPIPLKQMSMDVIQAVIATEDEEFFNHQGIVPKSILRAVFEQVTGTGSSGGSTLTQQLIKQQILTSETTFERKANEMMLAIRLEDAMSKHDIIEAYLNVSPFGRNNRGENIAGIEEAAQGIFGVTTHDLTIPQAAFVAGLPQSPIEYSPYDPVGNFKEDMSSGINRQKNVLYFMFRESYLTEEEYNTAINYDITQDFLAPRPPSEKSLSYLYDEVERRARDIFMEKLYTADGHTAEEIQANAELRQEYYDKADYEMRYGGYRIHTTIHKEIHDIMENTIAQNASMIGSPRDVYWQAEDTGETQHLVDYAQNGSLLLENETGRILGFVGGINYNNNQVNHATQTRRQPASVLKPLAVYGPALEHGIITPASMVFDRELTWNIPGSPPFRPGNAIGFSNRWWDVREALYVSQNIPALRFYEETYQKVNIINYLRNAGIGPDAIPDSDGATLSLALGGVTYGTTVEEITGAISSIANDGQFADPFMIELIEKNSGEEYFRHETSSNQVFTEQTAFLLQDILRDTTSSSGGTASTIPSLTSFNADIVSKTGTSDDTRDIWYVASTPKVTLGSWIGYDNIMKINNLDTEFGLHPNQRNLRLWSAMANAIHASYPDALGVDLRFDQPEGIVQTEVLTATGMKPGRVAMPSGEIINLDGAKRMEYFLEDFVPGVTTYDFAINAKGVELERFWKPYIDRINRRPAARPSTPEEDDDEDDQDEDTPEPNPEETEESADTGGSSINDIIDDLRSQIED